MLANGHFGGTGKSRYSGKQLKKKFIKGVRILESYKNDKRIKIFIDFYATFFVMYYSHLKVIEEVDDRIPEKLGDTKRNTVLENISSKKKYQEKEKRFWINLYKKKKKYKRSMNESINQSSKISVRGRIKALNRRRK
jgi:hypothetical protein